MKRLRVMCLALLMGVFFTTPLYAADWNFYGSVRLDTYYVDTVANGYGPLALETDNTQLVHKFHDYNRVGARVQVSDTLYGRFEYGADDGDVNIRMLYGRWNFGKGRLYVGQYYTPLTLSVPNQAYDGQQGVGFGAIYGGRQAGIKLDFLQGAIQLGAYDPSAEPNYEVYGVAQALGTSQEYKLPKLEASVYLPLQYFVPSMSALTVYGGVGYQTYEADGEDVDSYVIAGGAKVEVGAFYLAGNLYAGQNVNQMYHNWFSTDAAGMGGNPVMIGGKVYDDDAVGFLVYGGWKVNDMIQFEAGYGTAEAENDSLLMDKKDDGETYYLQAVITLAPGVIITPEVGVIDYGKGYLPTGFDAMPGYYVKQPKVTYFGLQWRIDF